MKDDNTTITANVAISLYHILDTVSVVTQLYHGRKFSREGHDFQPIFFAFFLHQKMKNDNFWKIVDVLGEIKDT